MIVQMRFVVPCMSWSPSSHPVCCGGGCSVWVTIGSLSMQHVCCSCSLCPVCCGGGCGVWVTVVVFTHAVWGRGCHRCGACVVVVVFPLCVVVVGAACGSPLQSSLTQRGAAHHRATVDVAHVVVTVFMPCVLWSWVRCVGLWLSPLRPSTKLRMLRRHCPLGVESNVKGSSH